MKRLILVLENNEKERIELTYVSPKENGWYVLESCPIEGLVAADSKISWFNGSYWFWKRSNIPSSQRQIINEKFSLVRTYVENNRPSRFVTYNFVELRKEKI